LCLLALADRDAALRADTRARTDTASVMFAKTDAAASRHVGTNGGTAAGHVRSYDTLASRIRAFHAAGIERFRLQFQPFGTEMQRFAVDVLPRVR
jgi:alkanesulfonate monooxygenase